MVVLFQKLYFISFLSLSLLTQCCQHKWCQYGSWWTRVGMGWVLLVLRHSCNIGNCVRIQEGSLLESWSYLWSMREPLPLQIQPIHVQAMISYHHERVAPDWKVATSLCRQVLIGTWACCSFQYSHGIHLHIKLGDLSRWIDVHLV
jgi:hypothetical protein